MYIFFSTLLFILVLIPNLGNTADLLKIYQLAKTNDPIIQAAREALLAAEEACPQARALFLPVLGATASATNYNKDYYANNTTVSNLSIPLSSTKFHYEQNVYALTLTQPVFYYQQWVQLAKASNEVKQANAIYAAAEQDLMSRTVQRYFAVLKAIDALNYTKSQREAFGKFLEQTKQGFNVGITPVTDVQIAQARFDSAYSQEITAENNIAIQKELLEEITGEKIDNFSFLKNNLETHPPKPANIEQWVNKALDQNFNLQAARFLVKATREDIKLNRAGHLPVLNINGQVIQSSGTKDIFSTPKNTDAYIGLQVAVPLFNGGSITSKTRQARHIHEQTQKQMEATYRQVKSNTRQAYLGVITQINQIKALKQSIAANQTALESTDGSFKEGTRTIVDVLNSQSDLIKSQQDYSNARYDYIIQSILLKQAAGTLCPEDIALINNWLKS